ncbi:Vibriobactin-specific isochorismatase [Legionella massiliensis]|uniref:Vibriobactin-specific isochorismatase n=1 Tax=Legionella massiliensis TaxID=1034943 RepID=A0A078KXA9_9GAMM|nr:hydrolase [Legionella massiliensis]CDZ79035.1 Vibriobactin-specific isochorismatase [Legionella massiliensis]CEE14773.1 Vibriobactin-specific isochorismatase [Legionella massiliensis]
MLLERDKSCLLLIDVQEKLTPHVQNSQALVARCQWTLRLAKELGVSILVSEQYPSGLGSTVEPLRGFAPAEDSIEKVQFSCFRSPSFKQKLQPLQKKQMVLIGIETHVCVLQTALDLVQAGYEVFAVVDAVASRSELDYKYGLKRMKQEGVHLVTSEMVFFEWVGQAGTPEFKALSKAYLQ